MSLLTQIGNVLGAVEEFELGVFQTFFSIKDDVSAFAANLQRLKKFQFDPKWNTRVINVPQATDAIKTLLDEITTGLSGRVRELIDAIKEFENLVTNVGRPDEGGGGAIADFLSRLASLKLGLVRLREGFHAVLDLEQTVIDVKQRLETLDDLFLPQGSTKTTVEVKYRKRNA